MSYPTVAGNSGRRRYRDAGTDFPLYLPRPFQRKQELKYIDSRFSEPFSRAKTSGGYPEADYFNLVPLPTAGDGLTFRLADRIQLLSLIIRGAINGPDVFPDNVPLSVPVEYFVIYDRFPTAVAPAARDLFTIPSLEIGCGLLQLPSSRDRFDILYRFRYVVGAQQIVNGPVPPGDFHYPAFPPTIADHVVVDENLDISLPTSFKGTGGASIDQISSGALYLYASGATARYYDIEDPQNSYPYIVFNVRLLFADL